MLRRRFTHDEWELPKLIVVDGGKAQKTVAEKVLREFGYQIPLVSVVKDEFHRPREILGDKKQVEKYSMQILKANAETHRFAVNFHRKRARSVLK